MSFHLPNLRPPAGVADEWSPFVRQLNGLLRDINESVNTLAGLDGRKPLIGSDLDMGANAIVNLADPVAGSNAVTLSYLREKSIVADAGGNLVANAPIIAHNNVRVPEPVHQDDLIRLRDLEEYIDGIVTGGGGGGGTVTSVGLSAPSQFSVTGSPVTTSGTLALAWANQLANVVLAGPSSGGAALPTFRALVSDDIPTLAQSKITNLVTDLSNKQPLDADLTEFAALANVRGDLLVTNATPEWSRLAIGPSGRFLRSDGTDPSWQTIAQADVTNLVTDLAGKQPLDADLTALAALSATAGMLSRTGAGAFTARTLTAPAAGFTITNPTGSGGDPTFALANDLAAVEGLSTTGIAVRTASDTWTTRTLTTTSDPSNAVTLTFPDGVGGNPVIDVFAFNISHSLLNDLNTGDDHSRYVWREGRTGTANDTLLSTDATGTLTGSGVTTGHLDLFANDETWAAANTGRIRMRDRVTFTDNRTFTAGISDYSQALIRATGTLTFTGVNAIILPGFAFEPTFAYDTAQSATLCPAFYAGPVFQPSATITDGAGATTLAGFYSRPRYMPSGASIAPSTPNLVGYAAAPSVRMTTGTSATVTNVTAFGSYIRNDFDNGFFDPNFDAKAVVTTLRHFWARMPGTTPGTITDHITFEAEDITSGSGVRAGFRSAVAQGTGRWGILGIGTADNSLEGGLQLGADSGVPDTILQIQANAASTPRRGAITFVEDTTTPGNLTTSDRFRVYMKADKIVFQVYNTTAAGTRYFYFDTQATANQSLIYNGSTAP